MKMKTTSGVVVAAMVLFVLAFAFTGCGGGGGGGGVHGGYDALPAQAHVVGRIVDMDDKPVAGVEVKMTGDGAGVTTTDADGKFSVPVTRLKPNETVLKLVLSKAGYSNAYSTVRIMASENADGIHSVSMRMERASANAADATSASVVKADGTTVPVTATQKTENGVTFYETSMEITPDVKAVTFTTPPDTDNPGKESNVAFSIGGTSAGDSNAAAVLGTSGRVSGSVSYGDPTNLKTMETFPGDFSVKTADGSVNTLITAGFTKIDLKDSNGNLIKNFAAGMSA